MSWFDFALLVGAGCLAGGLNVVAVAGAPLTFLALLAVGLPVPVANATNLAGMPASFLVAIPRTWRNRAVFLPYWPVAVVAAVGCVIGVVLVTLTGGGWLQVAAPGLLVVAAFLIYVQPALQPKVMETSNAGPPVAGSGPAEGEGAATVVAGRASAELSAEAELGPVEDGGGVTPKRAPSLVGLGVGLLGTGVYAGMFGGGVGALVVAVLLIIGHFTDTASQDGKLAICLVTSVVGAIAFAFAGHVAWEPCLAVATGMVIGGSFGGRLLDRLPVRWLRWGVIAATVGAALWLVIVRLFFS